MAKVTHGRTRDLVDGALLVEYPDASDDAANQAATALARDLAQRNPSGLLEAIPGARTLLLLFDPLVFARGSLEPLLSSPPDRAVAEPPRTVRIPVCYGGELGPDLEELSRMLGISSSELSRKHRDSAYRVAFIGFAPGFPYLIGLPPELHAPRLASPRTRVPAGSVGIGGPYTGIYPSDTPGGWRLIGNAPVRLFDPFRSPPSLLLPGDRVAFEEIEEREHQRLRESLASPLSSAPDEASRPVLRVLSPGLFTSVQGAPRFGLGRSGVPAGGAMDLASFARANAALGNTPFAPALEMTLAGPRLEVCDDCRISVAGEIEVAIDGAPVAKGRACLARAGAQLTLGAIGPGARAYLAIEGGIQDRLAGMVTRRLARGDELTRPGDMTSSVAAVVVGAGQLPVDEQTVRAVLGPQEEHFTETGRNTFLSTSYRVSPQSDRRGVRLEGARIELARPADIAPEGTAPGAIQVPGDGLPIVLGPDRPVTGGYAKIATVIGADLPLIGQLRPGTAIRFRAVSIHDAISARRG